MKKKLGSWLGNPQKMVGVRGELELRSLLRKIAVDGRLGLLACDLLRIVYFCWLSLINRR